MPTLETKRLQLIPFTLELKKAALNDRARLVEMLGVFVPEHWPQPDLAEALPFFIENMEKAPEYRNQGYATEMARNLIGWAFQEAGIKVVTASCLDNNIGSIKVLENVGMRRLGSEDKMLKWEICSLS